VIAATTASQQGEDMMPDDATDPRPSIEIDRALALPDAFAIADGRACPVLAPAAVARCRDAHRRLCRVIAERRHVYGLTTGFGPLADRLVDPEDGVTLQRNLVHHLATGLGPDFGWTQARAIVLARLMSIAQGVSGASEASVSALLALLRSDLAPAIPSRGTVGASGDLTPLAHMTLCFQGRGAFLTRRGGRVSGPDALCRIGIAPLDLLARDGLALVNGTSAMTGVALCNSAVARRLIDWSIALSAVLLEIHRGRREAWDMAFARARPHDGQIAATTALRARLEGATRLTEAPLALRRLKSRDIAREDRIGQDAYSLRCVPQVIGAVIDALDWHDRIVATELCSVSDNPIFPAEREVPALHGGNFMGCHVALAADSLAVAATILAGLAERQIARLTDERLNGGLPPFLQMGPPGLNSGLMGAQVTATAVLAELRSRGPASVHSISTNGANQDVVSMGTVAARHAAGALDDTAEILAILAMGVAQAMDILRMRAKDGFSPAAWSLHAALRQASQPIEVDRPLAPDIVSLSRLVLHSDPPA
jgi:tyrosine ammonia-lyase